MVLGSARTPETILEKIVKVLQPFEVVWGCGPRIQGSKRAKASGAEKCGHDWVSKGHLLYLPFGRADFTKPLLFPMRKKLLEYTKIIFQLISSHFYPCPPYAKCFLTRFTLISKMIKFDLSWADFSPWAEKLEPWHIHFRVKCDHCISTLNGLWVPDDTGIDIDKIGNIDISAHFSVSAVSVSANKKSCRYWNIGMGCSVSMVSAHNIGILTVFCGFAIFVFILCSSHILGLRLVGKLRVSAF